MGPDEGGFATGAEVLDPGSGADKASSLTDRAVRWMPVLLVWVLLGWVAARAARPISDPDDWWHLRLGNDLIDQHSLAAPSHWSVFATVPWVPTEPVPEILSAYVDRWFGLPGLSLLYDVAATSVVLTVYLVCRRYGDRLPAAVVTVFVVLVAAQSLTSRPQLVSFVLLPRVIDAWLRTERDHRVRWWLVPLIWAWSLCHGFWFVGAGYGVLFVLGFASSRTMPGRRLARHALVAVGSFAVVALNPVGVRVLEAPLRVNDTSRYIEEWARTDLGSLAAVGGLTMVVGTGLMWVVSRRGTSWPRALVVLSALFWIWYASRTVALAALVVAPLLTEALDHLVKVKRPLPTAAGANRSFRLELFLVGGVAALAGVLVAVMAPFTSDRPGGVPTALDAYLDRLPAGTRVLNSYELGGWIAWRHPDLEQYIDGLITPYSAKHAHDYNVMMSGSPGWWVIVRQSHADAALLHEGVPLAAQLSERGWFQAGRDRGYVLLLAPTPR